MKAKTHAVSKAKRNDQTEDKEQHVNLSALQRAVSLATGGVMLLRALRNRSLIRGIGAGYLLYRGATGKCPASEIIGQDIMDLNPVR